MRCAPTAPTLIALGTLGMHIAMTSGRLPALIELAPSADAVVVSSLLEAAGYSVSVHGPVLSIEDGITLRLISPCSSIWPLLTVSGALGAGLGLAGHGSLPRTYLILGFAALSAIGINVFRLAIMGTSMGAYQWLHDGMGSLVLRLTILATIILGFAAAIFNGPSSRLSKR